MIRLDLTPDDAETLRAALEIYLSELRTEISHTDTPSFREGLIARKAVLGRILDSLTPSPVAGP